MTMTRGEQRFHDGLYGLMTESQLMEHLPKGIFIGRCPHSPAESRWRLYSDMAKGYISEAPTVRILLINYYRKEHLERQ